MKDVHVYGMTGCGISQNSYNNIKGACSSDSLSKLFTWVPPSLTGKGIDNIKALLKANNILGKVKIQWPVTTYGSKFLSGIEQGLTDKKRAPLTLESLQKMVGIKNTVPAAEYFTGINTIRGKTSEIISRDYFKIISNNKILFISLGIIFIILIGLGMLFFSTSKSKLKR